MRFARIQIVLRPEIFVKQLLIHNCSLPEYMAHDAQIKDLMKSFVLSFVTNTLQHRLISLHIPFPREKIKSLAQEQQLGGLKPSF